MPRNDGRSGPMQPDDKGPRRLVLVSQGPGNNQTRWVDEGCRVPHRWIGEARGPLTNDGCYRRGWVLLIGQTDPGALERLLTAEQFAAFIGEEWRRGRLAGPPR